MVKLSLGLWGGTVDEMVRLAADAETAGFWGIWSHELHRSTTVPLAAAATRTSRIQLGSGIQLAFARSALITTLTALDLDELSGGRFNLGLGTGVKRLMEDWHSVPFGKPVKHLAETITAIRLLEERIPRGESLDLDGEYQRLRVRGLHRPFRPVREHVPIFVAAVGPALCRLAGRLADGWIGHELNTPQWLGDIIVPSIERGLQASGRARDEFTTVLTVLCVINSDRATAARQAAKSIAFYATVRTYAEFFASAGFAREAEAIGNLYRTGDLNAMFDAVPKEMIKAFALTGTPDDIRRGLRDYDGLADITNLSPPHHFLQPDEIRENSRAILELAGR